MTTQSILAFSLLSSATSRCSIAGSVPVVALKRRDSAAHAVEVRSRPSDLRKHVRQTKNTQHAALLKLMEDNRLSAQQTAFLPPVHSPSPEIDNTDEDVQLDAGESANPEAMLVDEEWFGINEDDEPELSQHLDDEAVRQAHLGGLDSDDVVIDEYPDKTAGRPSRRGPRPYATFEAQYTKSNMPYYPFANELDYDFAQWVVSESISNAAFDRLMSKDSVRKALNVSFHNAGALRKLVARIPCKAPFMKTSLAVQGIKKKLDVLYRDPKLVLEDLWSRIELQGKIATIPERRYTDQLRKVRLYSEFHTGDWMWRTQNQLPGGATTVPVTVFGDKTQLSQLIGVGANMAYPIYMTTSSIDSYTRRDISSDVHVMVALLPIINFKSSRLSKTTQRRLTTKLVHKALRTVFASLREASHSGMQLTDLDGNIYDGYPILAMEGLDYPEQCLHTGCSGCPKCKVKREDFAQNSDARARTPEETLRHLRKAMSLGSITAIENYLKNHSLNYVLEPFWQGWAHVNVHEAIAPDILHQLYQGLIKHLTAWCRAILGDEEMDARMQRIPLSFGLRHFENGISSLQRVSGTEHRAIAKQLACCMASTGVDKRVIRALAALLDFTYMVQYECHSDETLEDVSEVLDRFHENKDVFTELGACKDLNFPKMHGLRHYVPSIKLFGSLPGISTDLGERLHSVQVKDTYKASNKKKDQFRKQICTWNDDHQRMKWHAHFVADQLGKVYDPRKRPDTKQHEPIEFTKKPAALRTIPELVTLHHAEGLPEAVHKFLEEYFEEEWNREDVRRHGPMPDVPDIDDFTRLAIWHNAKFYTPDIQTLGAKDNRDIAYAVPHRARSHAEDEDDCLEARFSPVFVKKGEEAGANGTDGLRVGHLRVLFELPPAVVHYIKSVGVEPPGKLAFVQWYTKLGRRDRDSTMFKVSPHLTLVPGQGMQRQRASSVVEAIDIRRTCHLAPKLDCSEIPHELTAYNVLEDWTGDFWVNHWLDIPMYRSLL